MGDFFSILIWLIIIISFVSSVFKKKNPQAPPPQRRVPQDRPPVQVITPSTEYQQKVEEYDILKEIENMFKTEAEKNQPSVPPQERRTKIEQAGRKRERDYSEQKVESSEHEAESVQPELSKARKIVIDSRIEAEAKRLEEYLEKRSFRDEATALLLIKKLKDPKALRDFVFVSEILSRPKALRR